MHLFTSLSLFTTIVSIPFVAAALDPTTMQGHLSAGAQLLGTYSQSSAATASWMSSLDDSTTLQNMSIPGTHDTLTCEFIVHELGAQDGFHLKGNPLNNQQGMSQELLPHSPKRRSVACLTSHFCSASLTTRRTFHFSDNWTLVFDSSIYELERIMEPCNSTMVSRLWFTGIEPAAVVAIPMYGHSFYFRRSLANVLLDQTAQLEDIFWGLYQWLDGHSTETVIVSVKVDNGNTTASLEQTIYNLVTGQDVSNYWVQSTTVSEKPFPQGALLMKNPTATDPWSRAPQGHSPPSICVRLAPYSHPRRYRRVLRLDRQQRGVHHQLQHK
jgi:hypothetical protein